MALQLGLGTACHCRRLAPIRVAVHNVHLQRAAVRHNRRALIAATGPSRHPVCLALDGSDTVSGSPLQQRPAGIAKALLFTPAFLIAALLAPHRAMAVQHANAPAACVVLQDSSLHTSSASMLSQSQRRTKELQDGVSVLLLLAVAFWVLKPPSLPQTEPDPPAPSKPPGQDTGGPPQSLITQADFLPRFATRQGTDSAEETERLGQLQMGTGPTQQVRDKAHASHSMYAGDDYVPELSLTTTSHTPATPTVPPLIASPSVSTAILTASLNLSAAAMARAYATGGTASGSRRTSVPPYAFVLPGPGAPKRTAADGSQQLAPGNPPKASTPEPFVLAAGLTAAALDTLQPMGRFMMINLLPAVATAAQSQTATLVRTLQGQPDPGPLRSPSPPAPTRGPPPAPRTHQTTQAPAASGPTPLQLDPRYPPSRPLHPRPITLTADFSRGPSGGGPGCPGAVGGGAAGGAHWAQQAYPAPPVWVGMTAAQAAAMPVSATVAYNLALALGAVPSVVDTSAAGLCLGPIRFSQALPVSTIVAYNLAQVKCLGLGRPSGTYKPEADRDRLVSTTVAGNLAVAARSAVVRRLSRQEQPRTPSPEPEPLQQQMKAVICEASAAAMGQTAVSAVVMATHVQRWSRMINSSRPTALQAVTEARCVAQLVSDELHLSSWGPKQDPLQLLSKLRTNYGAEPAWDPLTRLQHSMLPPQDPPTAAAATLTEAQQQADGSSAAGRGLHGTYALLGAALQEDGGPGRRYNALRRLLDFTVELPGLVCTAPWAETSARGPGDTHTYTSLLHKAATEAASLQLTSRHTSAVLRIPSPTAELAATPATPAHTPSPSPAPPTDSTASSNSPAAHGATATPTDSSSKEESTSSGSHNNSSSPGRSSKSPARSRSIWAKYDPLAALLNPGDCAEAAQWQQLATRVLALEAVVGPHAVSFSHLQVMSQVSSFQAASREFQQMTVRDAGRFRRRWPGLAHFVQVAGSTAQVGHKLAPVWGMLAGPTGQAALASARQEWAPFMQEISRRHPSLHKLLQGAGDEQQAHMVLATLAVWVAENALLSSGSVPPGLTLPSRSPTRTLSPMQTMHAEEGDTGLLVGAEAGQEVSRPGGRAGVSQVASVSNASDPVPELLHDSGMHEAGAEQQAGAARPGGRGGR